MGVILQPEQFLQDDMNALGSRGQSVEDDEVFLPPSPDPPHSNNAAPPSVSFAVMSKSRTAPGRLSPRRIWPARSKSQPRVPPTPAWTPQGDCRWMSRSGRQVTLSDSHLTLLTDAERKALRQVALAKLQALSIGCHITLPKERNQDLKTKKRPILLKKRAVTTGFFAEKKAGKNVEERVARGMVFGVPLGACVYHERRKALGISTPRSKSTSFEDLMAKGALPRSSSRSSFTLILDPRDDKRLLGTQEAQSYESLNLEPVKRRSLLGLSDPFPLEASSSDGDSSLGPYIPEVVQMCLKHIETYGLHTLGIFRVSSSRKRVRQLREEFDSGQPVDLGSQQCPHDVATLLKEYFRDLPEPLLTRELYPAYVASQKVRNRKNLISILRYLTQLLPIPNGDTLWALLNFLSTVAANASDHRNAAGDWVPGNKMDSNNLATLFGPNVLHTVKNTTGGEREFVVLTAARAEERIDVINALRCMIDNHKELYHISAEYLDEVYRFLYDKDPDCVEYLMKLRLHSSEIDVDFDTSSSLPEGLDTSTCITISTSEVESNLQNGRRRDQTKSEKSKEEADKQTTRERETKSEGSAASRFFRRQEKTSSRPAEGSPRSEGSARVRKGGNGEEETAPSRWFRRRDRSTTKNVDAAINAVHQETNKKTSEQENKARRCREKSSPSRARPLTVAEGSKVESEIEPRRRSRGGGGGPQQVSVVDIRKEHLHVPEDRHRRLSYPEADNNVISASLTLKVPSNKKAHASTLGAVALRMDDRDIPYIEDLGPDQDLEPGGGRRTSGQSYGERRHCSSPFLGSLDESSATLSSVRSVGGVKHRSGSTDPLPDLLAKDKSGLRKPHYSQDSVLSSEGASSVSAGEAPSPHDSLRHTLSSDFGCASSYSGASTPLSTGSPSPWQWSHSTPSSPRNSPPSQKRVVSPLKSDKRRHSGSRSSAQAQGGEWPQETWKRWEIIASEHTEQETLV